MDITTVLILIGFIGSGGIAGFALGQAYGYRDGFAACSEIWDERETDEPEDDDVLMAEVIS